MINDISDSKSCEFTTVYYRGTVSAIIASDATFHVTFDDGDVNDRLDRGCLRPFKPFRLSERVQLRTSQHDNFWIDGVVVEIHSNTNDSVLVDVQTIDGMFMAGINTANIRRHMGFQQGDEVSVLDEQDEEWYPAKILRVDSQGNYLIQYLDGEIEVGVESHRIER